MYKYCYSNLGAIYAKGLWFDAFFVLQVVWSMGTTSCPKIDSLFRGKIFVPSYYKNLFG